MIFNKEGATTIITQEKSTIIDLVKAIEESYKSIQKDHIIVHLFSIKEFTAKDLNEFLRISKNHKASNRSFVIVSDKILFNEVPRELIVVPTLKEAHDMIEMEEIERDLNI